MKTTSPRFWIWHFIICAYLWLGLITLLTTLMNRRTEAPVTNELLRPVTAKRIFNSATLAASRSDYETAIEGFDRASESYLRLSEQEFCDNCFRGIAECSMGSGHARRALGDLDGAFRDYRKAEEIVDVLATVGQESDALVLPHDCLVNCGSTLAAMHESLSRPATSTLH